MLPPPSRQHSLGATSPLHHDFSGRLNQTAVQRKVRESHVHSALNRIAVLEEAEARAMRAVLLSRERMRRADALRSSLPPLSPLASTATADLHRPLFPAPLGSPMRPGTSSTYLTYGLSADSFGLRPPSPTRLSGRAAPLVAGPAHA